MIEWLKALWAKLTRKKPEPVIVQPDIKPTADEQDFYHPATITHSLRITGIWPHKVTFAGDTRNWPEGHEAGCHGECHLFVKRHENWIGGMWDHVRNNTFDRDFNNVHNGYGCWASIRPDKGEQVGIIFISYDHKKRTNITFSKWR